MAANTDLEEDYHGHTQPCYTLNGNTFNVDLNLNTSNPHIYTELGPFVTVSNSKNNRINSYSILKSVTSLLLPSIPSTPVSSLSSIPSTPTSAFAFKKQSVFQHLLMNNVGGELLLLTYAKNESFPSDDMRDALVHLIISKKVDDALSDSGERDVLTEFRSLPASSY